MNEHRGWATAPVRLVIMAAAAAGLLAACGGGGGGVVTPADTPAQASAAGSSSAAALDDSTEAALSKSRNNGAATPVAQPKSTVGRLLASNCFQCHGTLGTGGFDAIRGKDADEVLEFMRKPAASNIMAAHAQGYTSAQLQQIIAYLQQ